MSIQRIQHFYCHTFFEALFICRLPSSRKYLPTSIDPSRQNTEKSREKARALMAGPHSDLKKTHQDTYQLQIITTCTAVEQCSSVLRDPEYYGRTNGRYHVYRYEPSNFPSRPTSVLHDVILNHDINCLHDDVTIHTVLRTVTHQSSCNHPFTYSTMQKKSQSPAQIIGGTSFLTFAITFHLVLFYQNIQKYEAKLNTHITSTRDKFNQVLFQSVVSCRCRWKLGF